MLPYHWQFVPLDELVRYLSAMDGGRQIVSISICRFFFRRAAFVVTRDLPRKVS